MSAMSDAFKKARSAKYKSKAPEGSPQEEKSESKAQEKAEQAKGQGDRAPTVKDTDDMNDGPANPAAIPTSPMGMHGPQPTLDPKELHALLLKLMSGQHGPQATSGVVPHGTNFEQMGMDHVAKMKSKGAKAV